MLAGVAITITGCDDDDDVAPSPQFMDQTGTVSTDANHTHTAVITAAQFASMNWVIEHLGASAIVSPSMGLRDHLRAAIQALHEAQRPADSDGTASPEPPDTLTVPQTTQTSGPEQR